MIVDIESDPRHAGQVLRYHTWPVHRQQSVGEHSWQIARIMVTIWQDCPRKLLVHAVTHDVGQMAGDVPHQFKRDNPNMKREMTLTELSVHKSMTTRWSLPSPEPLHQYEMDFFKMCEHIEMWEFGLTEQNMGNLYGKVVATRAQLAACTLIGKMPEDIQRAARAYCDLREAQESETTIKSLPERSNAPKEKPYVEMTDAELSDELTRLTDAQGKATSWGAAVGVRAEYIKEIITIQSRRERRAHVNDALTREAEAHITEHGEGSPPMQGSQNEAGHVHYTSEPWVVTEDWLGASGIDDPLVQMFWTRRAPGVYVLEPNVVALNIPRVLRSCYNLRVGVGWVLDIRKCPSDVRDRFPNLLREQNMKEWEDLPEWERGLYEWNVQGNKNVLTQFTDAWHVETE